MDRREAEGMVDGILEAMDVDPAALPEHAVIRAVDVVMVYLGPEPCILCAGKETGGGHVYSGRLEARVHERCLNRSAPVLNSMGLEELREMVERTRAKQQART